MHILSIRYYKIIKIMKCADESTDAFVIKYMLENIDDVLIGIYNALGKSICASFKKWKWMKLHDYDSSVCSF